MSRSKSLLKKLEGINKKEGSVFEKGTRNLVKSGTFKYENSQLYIENLRIPIRAIRSVDTNFNEGRALVFVGEKYNLGLRPSDFYF
jgi:hypothetical protein